MTSTYVENTVTELPNRYTVQDDLHIRGEYFSISPLISKHLGWPPHTWRILLSVLAFHVNARMTSTYVENTRYSGCWKLLHEDDLHIRGEYTNDYKQIADKSGWPPHTWRIRIYGATHSDQIRMTSTYVENTLNDPRYINISQSK